MDSRERWENYKNYRVLGTIWIGCDLGGCLSIAQIASKISSLDNLETETRTLGNGTVTCRSELRE